MCYLKVIIVFIVISISITTVSAQTENDQLFFKTTQDMNLLFDGESLSTDDQNAFFDRLIERFDVIEISCPFKIQDQKLQQTYLLKCAPSDLDKIYRILKGRRFIDYVEYVPKYETYYVPNDPNFANQWSLGQINAGLAWDITLGSNDITVAIVDDAVQLSHPDLQAAIWVNPNEIAGNNIDDDGNGYVDDINGWDAADNDNDPNPPNNASVNNFSHGTHVAGISGAVTDNATGMASIGSGIELMAVKIAANSTSQLTGAFAGLEYAVINGYSDVINMSWGGGSYSSTMQNIINVGHASGIVLVAAAGNSNTSAPMYPASYNNVISVAATDVGDVRASFTNYGTAIDVSAPGVDILSTVPGGSPAYAEKSGTSMASPMVAGLCALMLTHNPAATPDEIENCLESTAVDIDGINPSYANQLGAGRVDAEAALSCLAGPPIAKFESVDTFACIGGNVQFNNESLGIGPLTYSWSFPGGVPNSSNLQNPVVNYPSAGIYSVTLTVTNVFGSDTEVKTNYLTVGTPSASLSGTSTILQGGSAFLTIDFVGTPPFSIDYTDGINTYTEAGITNNPYYFSVSPVDTSNYSLVSMTDGGCAGTVSGLASLNVIPNGLSNSCFYTKNYGDSERNLVYDIMVNPINGITYVIGTSELGKASLTALDNEGDILWSKEYTGLDLFQGITKADNNNDLLLVRNQSNDIQIVRMDENGNVIWAKNYDGGTDRFAKKILPLPGLNEYIVISWYSTGFTADDLGVTRIDGAGNVLSIDRYDINDDQPEDFIISGDTLRVVGMRVSNGVARAFSYSIDLTNNNHDGYMDNNTLTNSQRDYYFDTERVSDGFISVGTHWNFNLNAYSPFLQKTDFDDNVLWSVAINQNHGTQLAGPVFFVRLMIDVHEDIYVSYSSNNNPSGTNDGIVAKFDTNGNLIKAVSLDNTIYARMKSLKTLPIDNIFLFGNSSNYPSAYGQDDVLLSKMDTSLVSCVTQPVTINVSPLAWSQVPFTFTKSTGNYIITSFNLTEAPGYNLMDTICASECDSSFECPPNLVLDTMICIYDSLQLFARGDTNFLWFPNSNISEVGIRNPIVFPSANTTYWVNAVDTNGCSYSDTFNIVVNNLPNVNIYPRDTTICPGNSFQYEASGGLSYHWSPSGDLSNAWVSNPTFTAGNSDTLLIEVTDLNGCQNSDSVAVSVLPCCGAMADFSASDTIICINEYVSFTNQSISGIAPTFTWDFGSGAVPSSFTGATPPPIQFTQTGVNVVSLILSDNCGADTMNFSVFIQGLPVVEIADDTVVCDDLSFNYELGGSEIIDYTYNWTPTMGLDNANIANPIASVSDDVQYLVEVIDNFTGCILIDSVEILVDNDIMDIIGDSIICAGDSLTLTVNTNNSSIVWNTGDTNLIITAFPSQSMEYYVVDDSDICPQDTVYHEVSIIDYPLLIVNESPLETFVGEQILMPITSSAESWIWDPADDLSCNNCANPILTATASEVYTVTASNSNCDVTDTVEVFVSNNNICMHIPTAFSPNKDGINDVFYPISKSSVDGEIIQFDVYNRWGEKIWANPTEGWDGSYKSVEQLMGVYLYSITFTCEGEKKTVKGNVTLLR